MKIILSESVLHLIESSINFKELNPQIKIIKANYGEIFLSYITDDGVEIALNPHPDACYYNREQIQADFAIETIVSQKRGLGLASRELKKILDFADKYDYSVSLSVDSKGATTNSLGEKELEIGLSDNQLKNWYSKYGFLFEKGSACGYRPKKSEKQMFSVDTITLSIEDIDINAIESISDPETLNNLLITGQLEENQIYEDGEDCLYLFKNGKLLEVTNIHASWDYNTQQYKLEYK